MELACKNLRKHRGSWSLEAEAVFCEGRHLVTGKVGCGKTTLALLLAGCEKPDGGVVEKKGIGSVLLSLQFPEYQVTGSTSRQEVHSWHLPPEQILSDCGLAGRGDDDIGTLSQGELKALHLACVLSRDDDLLILDEPYNLLDPWGKQWVSDRISSRMRGITLVLTHEQSFFPRIDHIWEIDQGTLAYTGKVPECLLRWRHAPAPVRELVERGFIPGNISRDDILEAACRTRG